MTKAVKDADADDGAEIYAVAIALQVFIKLKVTLAKHLEQPKMFGTMLNYIYI